MGKVHMEASQAVDILTQFNLWRRDRDEVNEHEMPDPKALGIAIDSAISALEASPYVYVQSLSELCHSRAKKAGWWSDDSNLPEKICLMHSELSEAMEGLRKDLGGCWLT